MQRQRQGYLLGFMFLLFFHMAWRSEVLRQVRASYLIPRGDGNGLHDLLFLPPLCLFLLRVEDTNGVR